MTIQEAIDCMENVLLSDYNYYTEEVYYDLTRDDLDWIKMAQDALKKQQEIQEKAKATKEIDFKTAKNSDFKDLPHITKLPESERVFDSLIIIPENHIHDSGYQCMSFVGCKGDKAVCLMGGNSDVIHLDGIGGYGRRRFGAGNDLPKSIPPKGWSIDCLPCGYLRIFTGKCKLTIGSMMSSFEIYAE